MKCLIFNKTTYYIIKMSIFRSKNLVTFFKVYLVAYTRIKLQTSNKILIFCLLDFTFKIKFVKFVWLLKNKDLFNKKYNGYPIKNNQIYHLYFIEFYL